MGEFIGRKEELATLRGLLKKKVSSFVVIRGRRRVGKSRLIQEFSADLPCHLLMGLPPGQETTKQDQIDEMLAQMAKSFGIPQLQANSWADVFWLLGQQCATGKVVLALDEISWMGSKDKTFVGQLKTAWDLHFSKNPQLILIVCGSVSSWIENNILSSTGFVGRISIDMHLSQLPLRDAAHFWNSRRHRLGAYEILKVLAITGGIPRYLEEVRPDLSAEENIRQLCFHPDGLLFREFEQLFSDLFSKKAPKYAEVLSSLADGPLTLEAIGRVNQMKRGGTLLGYVRVLTQAGFVREDISWDLTTGESSKARRYRLSDNYARFYLRYVRPNRRRVAQGYFKPGALTKLPAWDGMLGLQFENLVVYNQHQLFDILRIDPGDVLNAGPFIQTKTARRKGCQVDLLIQTRHHTLFLCEIKFSRRAIGVAAVRQLQQKQHRIVAPKNWSTRLVLIHVNGVTPEVEQSEDLVHIVDFGQLLEA